MRRLVSIVLVIAATGCVTPSIPIPPPDPSEMTFQLANGSVVFSYPPLRAYAGGTAYLQNQRTGAGVFQFTNPDGSIGPMQPLPAVEGDQLIVSVQETQQLESTCVVLHPGTGTSTATCQ